MKKNKKESEIRGDTRSLNTLSPCASRKRTWVMQEVRNALVVFVI